MQWIQEAGYNAVDTGSRLQCSGYRKQATMQWIQDPNQSNADNLNIVVYTFQEQKEGTCES